MHCPKCGQQQVVDEILFCSKCGLALSAISETIQNDAGRGNAPQSIAEVKRSALIGFALVTLSAVFLFATLIIGTPEPSFIVQMNLLVAVLVYLLALGYVLYKFLPIRKPAPQESQLHQANIEQVPTTRRLLNDQGLSASVAAEDFLNTPRPSQTVESSVTEDTTTLLDKS
ncbi:MAG TPA: zinc ribbon domain-containing protein [Pyrinomonadaceae bacterium]|nr:zinc ribbon domain-containing protein [Pyrinomonadaceae bacterium]